MWEGLSANMLLLYGGYTSNFWFFKWLCVLPNWNNMVHSRFWRVLVGGVYQLKHKLRRFLCSWSQNQTKSNVKSLHQESRIMASATIHSDVKTKREKIGRENLLQRNRWVAVQGNLNYGLLLFVFWSKPSYIIAKRDVVVLDSMHLLCFYCSIYQAVLWVDRSFRFFI